MKIEDQIEIIFEKQIKDRLDLIRESDPWLNQFYRLKLLEEIKLLMEAETLVIKSHNDSNYNIRLKEVRKNK